MDLGWPNIGRVLLQGIENVRRFVHAAADEVAEAGDVVVRHVPVGDPAGLAVPDMEFCEQVVPVGMKMGAIRRDRGARAPAVGQLELGVLTTLDKS